MDCFDNIKYSFKRHNSEREEVGVKKVLFISGSLGLGHVGRDLEIANMLRRSTPEMEISWLADYPATTVLKQAREKLLTETQMLTHGNKELERSAKDHAANLTRWEYEKELVKKRQDCH